MGPNRPGMGESPASQLSGSTGDQLAERRLSPEPRRRTLQLLVTEGCNLRCAYCFERDKRAASMSFETAMAAVEEYLVPSPDFDEVMIDFMGGEPMLAFPLIRRVVEEVVSRRWTTRYGFSMSTNGTLFNEENKAWLAEHRQVITPMLSFDGTKKAHDLNRSGSYDTVVAHIDFLREHWPFQHFKMTVNDKSLPYLADGVFSIIARGCLVDLNLVHENVWGEGAAKQRNLRIFEYELARLVDFYTEFPDIAPPNLLTLPLRKCLFPEPSGGTAWCGAGKAMVAVDKGGARHPCHRFVNFSAGKSMTLKEFEASYPADEGGHQCLRCVMRPACPTCLGCNWEFTGHTTERVTYNCEFIKLQMVATAILELNRTHIRYGADSVARVSTRDLLETSRTLDAVRFALNELQQCPQCELKALMSGQGPGTLAASRTRWNDSKDWDRMGDTR